MESTAPQTQALLTAEKPDYHRGQMRITHGGNEKSHIFRELTNAIKKMAASLQGIAFQKETQHVSGCSQPSLPFSSLREKHLNANKGCVRYQLACDETADRQMNG